MKIINKALALLLGCVSLVSCLKEDPAFDGELIKGIDSVATEKIDGGTISYQYGENTTVLTQKNLDYLIEIKDETTLVFREDIPAEMIPEVGDILSSRITDKTPYGLGNKVTSVRRDGDSYVIETEPATLEEIFQELEMDLSIDLGQYVEEGVYENYGTPITISKVPQTKASHTTTLMINLPELEWKSCYVTGDIYADMTMNCSISFRQRTHNFSVENHLGVEVSLGVKERLYKVLKIIDGLTLMQAVVPAGPVVLRPYMDFDLNFVPELEGSLSTTIGLDFGFLAGHIVDDSHNGFVFENKSEGLDYHVFKNIEIDATGKASFEAAFNVGTGLYTKRIAAELKPSVAIESSTSFSLNCSNLFRGIAEVDNSLRFAVKGAFTGYFVFDFFKSHLSDYDYKKEHDNFLELTIWDHEWPLFPVIDKESITVTKRENTGELTFDASYKLTHPGLLSKFMSFRPKGNIYKGSELIGRVDSNETSEYSEDEGHRYSFTITGMKEDIVYVFNPTITGLNDRSYEADGYPFSSTSPTAAITDIVQTDSAHQNNGFYFRGYNYDYKFSFYIKQHLIGADQCSEWGIYSPTSSNIYNPSELKDGAIIEYWSGYSDNPSVTFSYTPYVKLLDGSLKLYETKDHTLVHGSNPETRLTSNVDIFNTAVNLQLDSVVVNGIRVR